MIWQQNTQIKDQKSLIDKIFLTSGKIQEKLEKLENSAKSIGQPEIPVSAEMYSSMSMVHVKWFVVVVVVAVSVFYTYVFYSKLLNLTLLSFLPQWNIPLDWLPYLKKNSFFECILGEYSLRINISGKTVSSIEGKHLEDLSYQPLEELLRKSTSAAADILAGASKVLSVGDPSSSSNSVASTSSLAETSPLFFEPGIAEGVVASSDALASILSVI